MPEPEGFTRDQPPGLPEGFTVTDRPRNQTTRGLGLGVRNVIEGAGQLASFPADVVNPYLSLFGAPTIPRATPAFSKAADALNLPVPENPRERVMGDIQQAGTEGVLTMGVGAIPSVAKKAPLLSRMLMSVLEPIAAAAGGGGAGVAREMGAGQTGQMAAGMAAGVLAPSGIVGATSTVSRASRAAGALTRRGTERRVGQRLVDESASPSSAASNLENAQEIVPGSQPTSGTASGDVGLLGLEARLRSVQPQEFGQRFSQQNTARRAFLDAIIEGDPELMREARDIETSALREASLSGAPDTDIAPIISRIDQILESPMRKRDAVVNSMNWLKSKLEGVTSPQELYEIRKEIGDAIAGRLSGDQQGYRLASGQLIEVRKVLDSVIESVAPGFEEYLTRYRNLSRRADQAEALSAARDKPVIATPDPLTGAEMFSQAKFRRLVNNEKVVAVLSEDQQRVLDVIAADLDRGASISSGLVKASGSDTARNVTVANVVGHVFGGSVSSNPAIRTLLKPLEWIAQGTAEAQRDLLIEAMLDPKLAAQLMRRAQTDSIMAFSSSLRQKAQSIGFGAAIGSDQPEEAAQ